MFGTLSPAQAAGASITGSVSVPAGAPREDIGVTLNAADGDDFFWTDSTRTDANGGFSFSGVEAGTYQLSFDPERTTYLPAKKTIVVPTSGTVSAGATSLDLGGSVSGTLRGADGVLIDQGLVTVYPVVDGEANEYRDTYQAQTDATGKFKAGGLPTGTYRVKLDDGYGASTYVPEYYDDKTTLEAAADIQVTAGVDKPLGTVSLALGGSISGSVKAPGGAAVPQAQVRVYTVLNGEAQEYTNVVDATADDAGKFRVGGLSTGTYRVGFRDSWSSNRYAPEFHHDKATLESATEVPVTAGGDTPLGVATLAVGGTVSGTIKNPAGKPIANASVSVTPVSGVGFWGQTSDESGRFTVGGLPAGTYRVQFSDYTGTYLAEYYKDQPTYRTATRVTVTTSGDTPLGTITMDPAGSISGTVQNPEGGPIKRARVTVFPVVDGVVDETDEMEYYVDTDSSGAFTLSDLRAGTYRVRVDDDNRSNTYASEYFNDKATIESATDVIVKGGQDTAVGAVTLALGGSISGVMKGEDGATIPDPDINVDRVVDGVAVENEYHDVQTSADGTFKAGGLPTGTYRVSFSDGYGAKRYLNEYYNDKATFETATDIAVTLGKDASLGTVTLAVGGSISGIVQAGTGTGVGDVTVTAYAADAGEPDEDTRSYSTKTAGDGSYRLGALPTGTYRLHFGGSRGGFVDEYFGNTTSFEAATDVPVTVGKEKSLSPMTLTKGGSISGTVKNAEGAPIRWTEVVLFPVVDGVVGHTQESYYGGTDSAGKFTIVGLATGTYRVRFSDENLPSKYVTEYYNDKATIETATDVKVTAGADTPLGTVTLERGGSVSGTVTGADGGPLGEALVDLYPVVAGVVSQNSKYSAWTNPDGEFKVGSLPTGTYRVGVIDGEGRYAAEFYDDKSTLAAASDLTVTAGSDRALGTIQLGAGASISGKVAGQRSTWVDKTVEVVRTTDGVTVGSTEIGQNGSYRIGGLAAGSYRVEFARDSGRATAAAQFYDGVSEQLGAGAATPVVLAAGATRTGVDATLVAGGHIAGKLVDGSGKPRSGYQVEAFTTDGSLVSRTAQTTASGTFDIGGLTTGSYRLVVNPYGQRSGAPGYFLDSGGTLGTSPQSAANIAVTVGDTKTLVSDLVYSATPSTPSVSNQVPPKVEGTAQVGSVLTAAEGTWSPRDVGFTYQWVRGATDIAGATSRTYTPAAGDVGQALRVRVTGTKGDERLSVTSAATSPVGAAPGPPAPPVPPAPSAPAPAPPAPPAVVKVNPVVKVSGKGAKKKVTLTITVKASGATPTGRIVVKLGGKTLKTVTLKNGKVKITLTKQKKGKRAYKITYAGDTRVNPKVVTSKKIAIR